MILFGFLNTPLRDKVILYYVTNVLYLNCKIMVDNINPS